MLTTLGESKSKFLNSIRKSLFTNSFLEIPLKKFISGAPIGSWKYKLLPNHSLYPLNSYREVIRGQKRMVYDIGEWMEWAAYFEIPDKIEVAITNELKAGDVAIDVGTNIGSVLVKMADKIGKLGKVYGFEPSENRFKKAENRIQFEDLHNAELIQLALGSRNEFVEMSSPDPTNLGRNRVTKSHLEKGKVKCVTLDSWVKEKTLTKIDFIKIDVEGFEFEVLSGMTQVLKNLGPILFIEVDDDNLKTQGSSAAELLDFIKKFGYTIEDSTGKTLNELDLPAHFDVICRQKKT